MSADPARRVAFIVQTSDQGMLRSQRVARENPDTEKGTALVVRWGKRRRRFRCGR